MEYIEHPKVRHKKRGAADLNQTLPGDWFNWVGHFVKSIQGRDGVLLAVSKHVHLVCEHQKNFL